MIGTKDGQHFSSYYVASHHNTLLWKNTKSPEMLLSRQKSFVVKGEGLTAVIRGLCARLHACLLILLHLVKGHTTLTVCRTERKAEF